MNEYTGLIREEKETDLRLSMSAAVRGQPDTEAKLQKLSQRTGIALDAVRLNAPEVEYRDRLDSFDYERTLKENPKLSAWLADPKNAGVAHDDYENLSAAEKLFLNVTDLPRATAGGVIGQGAGSVVSGVSTLLDVAARGIDRPVRQLFGGRVADAFWYTPPRVGGMAIDPFDILKQGGQGLKDLGKEISPPTDRQNLATDVAQGVGQLGFQIAAFLLTGGASGTTMMMAQGADVMATKTAKDDADPAMRDTAIVTGAAITALTERYGIDKILNRLPPEIRNRTLRFIADKAAAGGIEAAQEFTEGLLHDITRYVMTNREAPILDGIEREMSAAALAAAIVRTAVGVRGYREASQQEDFFKALGDTAKASKLRERMPDRFRSLIEGYTKDGPVQNVYVPAAQFNQYFQSVGIDPAQIADTVGAENYHEALATGGDVEISMADFATVIAPTDHLQGLMDDLRLRQDDMTPREAREFEKNRKEWEAYILEQAKRDAGQTQAPDFEQIKQQILGELTGRFEAGTADAYATYFAKAITTMAQRAGVSATEMMKRYDPRVITPLPDVLRSMPDIDTQIDPLLDRLRAGDKPRQMQAFGASLSEFIRSSGGLRDSGETRDMDQNIERRPGQRKMVQPDGMDLDAALQAAIEAGYFSDVADPSQLTTSDLLNALGEDVGGSPRFSPTNENSQMADELRRMQAIEDYITEMGGDIATMDNASLKELLMGGRVGEGGTELNQSATIRSGKETLKKFGLDPNGRYKTREVAAALEARQRAKYGTIAADDRSPEAMANIAKWMAAEVEFEMQNPEQSGVGWYSEKFQRALDTMGEVFPELKTDKVARNTMTALIAITSDGQKVVPNFAQAMDIYGNFSATGQFTTTRGHQRQASIDNNLKVIQRLHDTMGAEAMHEYLMQEKTISELKKIAQANGGEMKSAYQAHIKMPMAAVEFGPKLGAFYANLMGAHGYLTMDRWWSRTFNRYRGTLLQAPTRQGLDRFKELIGKPEISDDEAIAATVEYRNSYEARGFKSGTEIEKAANTIWRAAFDSLEDSPFNAKDRTFMLDAANKAQKSLKRKGIDLSVADIQAILWYYEKRLYGELGARQTADISYEEAAQRVASSYASGSGIESLLYDDGAASDDGGADAGRVPVGEEQFSEGGTELYQSVDDRKPIQAAAIFVGGKVVTAPTHGQAINKAVEEGLVSRDDQGRLDLADGDDIDLFITAAGDVVDRFEADSLFGVTSSEGAAESGKIVLDREPRSWTVAELRQALRSDQFYGQSTGMDDKRGFIRFGDDRKFQIGLLEKADLSTFLHETGHFWLEIMGDLAADPSSSQQTKDDYAAILNWMGVKSRGEIGVKQHEMFARANEAYLMEGKAPSAELRGLFQRFKAWLTMIYRSVSRLDVELSPQVRGVFDRIYATDEEIAAAQQEMDARPMFLTAAEAGMSEAEFMAYEQSVGQATERAKEELQAKLMREFQREREKWWKDRRGAVRGDVAAEIEAMPEYQALAALVAGQTPDGTFMKLDREDLVRRYGAEYLKRLPRGFQRIYTASGGIDADTAAEMLGYPSGDDLITALVNARPKNELIEAETDRRMTKQYGDMRFDGSIAEQAMAAMHNTEREKVLRMELKALNAELAGNLTSSQVLRQMARGIVGQKQIRHLNPFNYLLAERKAAREAFDLLTNKGDRVEAFNAKQRELLNHYLYLEATKAKQEVDSIVEYLRAFEGDKRRADLGKAGADYLEQVDGILERYELKRVPRVRLQKREALAAWLNKQEAEGHAVAVPEELQDESRRVNYQQVNIDELRAVRDAVKNIAHLARLKNKLIRKGKLIDFEQVVGELIMSAEDSGLTSTGDLGTVSRRTQTTGERAAGLWRSFDAAHLKVEQLVEWLDGGKIDGPWARYLFDLADEAQTREFDLHREVTQKIQEITESMSRDWRGSLTDRTNVRLPGFRNPMTRYDLVSIAFNMGNAQNMQRLMDGYAWSQQNIDSVRNALTAEDWRFVQGVWDTLETLWPEMAALEKRMSGLEPAKVEALPFEAGGQQWRGGYFPLVYDPRKSNAGERQANEAETVDSFVQQGYGRATTNRGATKKRVEKLTAPVLLDYEQVLTSHMSKVIKDISHREAIIGINKILTSPQVKEVLIDRAGEAKYNQLRQWVQVLVADRADTLHQASGLGKVFMKARTNMAIVTMGWKISTMMAQFAGFGPSADTVKPSFLAKAMIQSTNSPAQTWAMVQQKSGEMRNRSNTLERDVKDALLRLRGEGGVVADVKRTAFYLTAMADRVVSVPTWLGGYQQALAEGKTEEDAVRAGDRAVRLSQGAGGAKDLAAVQRNNELMRLLTMYYTPFNVLYARLRDVGHKQAVEGIGYLPNSAARLLALLIIPAVLGELLAARGPDEEEDPTWWAIRKTLLYPIASVPVLRDFAGYFEAGMIKASGDGVMEFAPNYKFSPVVSAIERVGRAPGQIYDAATGEKPVDDVLWNLFETSGYIFGLPTAQVRISGEYLQDLLTGEAEPENAPELLRDLMYRRPRD